MHSTEAKPASSTGSGNSIAEQKLWNPLKKLCIEEIREIQKAQSIRFANGSDTGNTCTPPVSYDQLIKVTIGSHWNAAFTPISELLDTTALNTKPFE
ncbi:MAG: hypothetical protein PHD82_12700 [Candidatus Riflebacteria bacterium]|nr:hypothetical protein [Candidatus Riflebacteria bacterium]